MAAIDDVLADLTAALAENMRLEGEVERLRAALKPFAEWARDEIRKPTIEDCQRASTVYTNTEPRRDG